MRALGQNSILIDCDVLQADGGTRTASITGAYVALHDAVTLARRAGQVAGQPLRDSISAVSVGIVGGKVLLDLDYAEDSRAEVDMNVAMTGSGQFVEIQATAESGTFSHPSARRMLLLAARGIKQLSGHQARALKRRLTRRGPPA